jgi:hypothetical protein
VRRRAKPNMRTRTEWGMLVRILEESSEMSRFESEVLGLKLFGMLSVLWEGKKECFQLLGEAAEEYCGQLVG